MIFSSERMYKMKFYCDTKCLNEAISIVSKAVAVKSPIPHLEGILLTAQGGTLTLLGNNLEISIKTSISANISEEGSIVLNAKMFSDIVRKLPQDVCEVFSNEKNNVSINCLNADYKIVGLNAEEFPQPPQIAKKSSVNIKSDKLREIIGKTLFSVSLDNARKILTGSLYEIENNILTVVAVDGYRLALTKMELDGEYNDAKFIIPGKTQSEIAKIISGSNEENINISFSENYALIEGEGITITSRLIEGEFFSYRNTIPSESKYIVKTDCYSFSKAIERVEPIIDEVSKNCVRFKFEDGKIIISCETVLGKVNDVVECDYYGESLEIGFNYKYLHDAVSRCEGDEIELKMNSPFNPLIINSTDDDSYLFMVLPVRI